LSWARSLRLARRIAAAMAGAPIRAKPAGSPRLRKVIADSLVTVGVFALLVAVWCAAGSWLGSHERVVEVVRRFGRWIVPAAFMIIGAGIIVGSGVIGELHNA